MFLHAMFKSLEFPIIRFIVIPTSTEFIYGLPNILFKADYRSLTETKKFVSLKFNNELKNELTIENIDNCTKFHEKFLEVLDKHAPLKKSYLGQIMRHMFLRLYEKQ